MVNTNDKFAPQHRNPGDLILSDDWNSGMREIVRLESAKVNRQGGDSLQGPLTIEAALSGDSTPTSSVQLEVKGALKLADGEAVNQFSSDGSLSANRDTIVPTQKAVKTYVDTVAANLNTSVQGVIIKGMILMWSGQVDQIPTGWALCNGENETPDLRDRFIVGAGLNYRVTATGGAESVTLTIDQMPAHSHGVNDPGHNHSRGAIWPGSGPEQNQSGGAEDRTTFNIETGLSRTNISILNTGSGRAHENRPPYYALAFIMKL
jgi:microcystin-dependent protein